MGKKVSKVGAVFLNTDSSPGGVSYIYADKKDGNKFKIGRGTKLGEAVSLSIDRNGLVSGSFIGTFSGTDAGEVWTRSGNDIYYNTGNVGIGTTAPSVNLEVKYNSGETNVSASLNSSGSHHGILIHNSLSGTDDVFSNLDFTAGTTSTGRIALVDSPFEIETVVTSLASPRDVKVDSLGVATAGVPKIYYCDSSQNKIVQASLDGSQKNEIYTGLGSPGGIALDPTAGKIYWTDFHGSHDDIKVGDMDGSGPSSVVLSGLNAPFGIAIDAANSHLYFCDNGDNVIKRVDTDGDNETTLISGGDPNYIALDLINTPNKMYWTDFDAYEIKRADLDGTNPETLVELDPGSPRGIALDISAGKMYWVDEGLDTMSRANMDGSDVETLLTGLSFTTGMGIDTVQKTIYWGDVDDNDIHRICYQKGEFSFNPGVGEKMRISHRGVEIPVVDGNVVITGSLVVTQDVSGSNITGSFFTGSFIGDGSGLTGLPDADLWTATGNDIYYNTGDVGIGTSTPDEILHIKQSEASTTGSHSIARIEYYATDDFADGDGCSIKFAGGDAAEPNNVIGRLTVSRDGADNQGAFAFKCGTDGNEEFMRISSNGNVGIGTSTPGALLHLKPSTSSYNSAFRMESSTTSEDWYMYMNSDDSLVFRNDDLDFVSFQKDTGNVGIGTTDPDKTLTVVGDISAHSSSITQQTISNTSLNALTDVGAIANYHLYLECDYNDGQSAGIALGSSDNVGAAIIYKDVGAYAQGQLEFYTKASPTTLVDPVQRMVIAADGNVGIGTDTPQAPLDVFNGSTLLGMCILNASASAFDTNRFWCTTNLDTYKQVNDDSDDTKKPSITFTVPASNKVNITLKATIDDNVDARQLWKMRITDQDSETASGSWGANTINDENYSGRYYKNTSLRTFQWYFDGDDTALNWTPGESKTMWFQIKVNNTSETVSVRAGNAFAPIIVTAESVPDNVVFVDMDS